MPFPWANCFNISTNKSTQSIIFLSCLLSIINSLIHTFSHSVPTEVPLFTKLEFIKFKEISFSNSSNLVLISLLWKCISYFSAIVISQMKQLLEGHIYLGLSFQREKKIHVCHGGKACQQVLGLGEQETESSHLHL